MREWFSVDKEGLGKVLARRGIEFAVGELLQNAFDADGVTTVSVGLEPVPNRPVARLVVEDDSPTGFVDLKHAWVLFGGSTKAKNPEKRGKFDLGEKLVFAVSKEASVETTTGTVRFDDTGRHRSPRRRERGSRIEAVLPMTRADFERCTGYLRRVIPPAGVAVAAQFNGTPPEPLPARSPVASFETTLQTEIAGEDGRLRPTYRKARVDVYEPQDGEKGTLYEMGLPVLETGDAYHCDIQQRVPVGFDRDNVPPGYLLSLRAEVLNAVAPKLKDAAADWVTEGLGSSFIRPETVREVVRKRFGEKAVAYDPHDVEAVGTATAHGYTIVHGGTFGSDAWSNIRKADALPPAGRIFPTHLEPEAADEEIQPQDYTDGMKRVVRYARRLSHELLGFEPLICIVRHENGGYQAQWNEDEGGTGFACLTLNISRLPGKEKWFDQTVYESAPADEIVALLLHEAAHHFVSNHLSHEYIGAVALLGAKMRRLSSLDWE